MCGGSSTQVMVVVTHTLWFSPSILDIVSPPPPLGRYDDMEILAGQGTAALEVLEQMDRIDTKLDAVVIPVGGGGLLAGMATIFKHLAPQVKVIVSTLCIVLKVL